MLFDIGALAWSAELCELFTVPMDALPEVRPSSGDFGITASTAACGAGVPIRGVAGDQQAALFGQAAFEPGEAKNTYGTGSFVLMNVGSTLPEPAEGLLSTVAWLLGGTRGVRSDVRPGGRDLRHGRDGAMAARRPGDHRGGV